MKRRILLQFLYKFVKTIKKNHKKVKKLTSMNNITQVHAMNQHYIIVKCIPQRYK